MLELSHVLIFVAGAAGLAAFTTLVAKFFTVVDGRLPLLTGPDVDGQQREGMIRRRQRAMARPRSVSVVQRPRKSEQQAKKR